MRSLSADDVGQLFMFGFEGDSVADIPADLAAQSAGVVLFRHNLKDAAQVAELTGSLRRLAGATDPLIALDQEGGPVSRLAQFGTTTPSAMALGAAGDLAATEAMYGVIGTELAALGVNVDLAPVADITSAVDAAIGVRSFGDDPHAASEHVRAALRGLRSRAVAATAKHFPGYGAAQVDPHGALPTIARASGSLRAIDLVPFAAAIADGVDLIMTAHAVVPELDGAGMPATLSQGILTGVLRDELHYQGVVITDCMEMRAIAASFSPGDAAVTAIGAGADLVLFSHTPDTVRAAQAAVRAALMEGRLPAQRVAQSLQRVRQLRARLTATRRHQGLDLVGGSAHRAAALDIARRAVTLVRDPKHVLPLGLAKEQRLLVVEFAGSATVGVEESERRRRTVLGPFLEASPARLHEQVRTLDPAGHEYKQLLMAATAADAVVAITSRAASHPLQARAVTDLAMLGKRVVAVAGREPYDANVLPGELTVIASFGDDPNAMRAAADVILGHTRASGKLPVSLAGAKSAP